MADGAATRLGKRELGPHANEERMPERLLDMLKNEDDTNALSAIMPKLHNFLSRDPEIAAAYLCTESVVQVHKLDDEGPHFCGYRNMQMLCLALPRNACSQVDPKQKLNVLHLQRLIEAAWGQGINAHGRLQTGGIEGTRKHVGTSEAEALLLSLKIPCTGSSFAGKGACSSLLDHIEAYFSHTAEANASKSGVIQTSRPAIFLQRPRHSVTIVGLERLHSGKRRLLIFDPAWRPPSAMQHDLPQGGGLRWKDAMVLRRYRQSERSLKRFSAFETLVVDL